MIIHMCISVNGSENGNCFGRLKPEFIGLTFKSHR